MVQQSAPTPPRPRRQLAEIRIVPTTGGLVVSSTYQPADARTARLAPPAPEDQVYATVADALAAVAARLREGP